MQDDNEEMEPIAVVGGEPWREDRAVMHFICDAYTIRTVRDHCLH
jgi:hypothetical protein